MNRMYYRNTATNTGADGGGGVGEWRRRPLPHAPSNQIVERTPSYSSQDNSPYKIDHFIAHTHSTDSLSSPGSHAPNHYHRYHHHKSRPAHSTSIYSTQTERRRTPQFESTETSTPSYGSSFYRMSNLAAIQSTDSLHDPQRFVPPRIVTAPDAYDSSQSSLISSGTTGSMTGATTLRSRPAQRRYTFFSPEPDTKRRLEVDDSRSELPAPPPLPRSLQRPGVVFQFGPPPARSRSRSRPRRMAKMQQRAELHEFEPRTRNTNTNRGFQRSTSTPPDTPPDPDSSFWIDEASEVSDSEWCVDVDAYGEEITYARQLQREKAKEADVFRARVKDFFGFK